MCDLRMHPYAHRPSPPDAGRGRHSFQAPSYLKSAGLACSHPARRHAENSRRISSRESRQDTTSATGARKQRASHSKACGQHQRQRNQNHGLPRQGACQCLSCFADALKERCCGHMQAIGEESQHIQPGKSPHRHPDTTHRPKQRGSRSAGGIFDTPQTIPPRSPGQWRTPGDTSPAPGCIARAPKLYPLMGCVAEETPTNMAWAIW